MRSASVDRLSDGESSHEGGAVAGQLSTAASTLASAVPLSFAATKRLEATGWPFSRIMLDLSRETLGKGLDVIAMGAGVKMIITTISIT